MSKRGPVVYANKATGSVASVTTTAVDTTAANLLVAIVSLFSNKFSGTPATQITDSKSNTWQVAVGPAGGGKCIIYYCENPTTDVAHTFTFTPTSAEFIAISVIGIADALTSSVLSNTNSASAGSDPRTSGSVSSVTDEIIIGGASAGGGAAAVVNGDNWFSVQLQPDGGTEGQVVGFTFAENGESNTFSGSNGSGFTEGVVIAGFKLNTGGGGTTIVGNAGFTS